MSVEDPRLAQIRALIRDDHLIEYMGTEYLSVPEVRAILDAPPVTATPPQDDGSPLMPPETLMERMDADGRMFRLGIEAATPPQGIDRDTFLALLDELSDGDGLFDQDELYQGLLALVRPVPPQDIDRDVLWQHVFDAVIDWDAQVDDIRRDEFVDQLVALVRPVEGVVLTSEEADLACTALRKVPWREQSNLDRAWALAARLEGC
jgi:hypothetical protein